MKKLVALFLSFSLLLLSMPSFAAIRVEPQSEPDGYIIVKSEKRTKVVSEYEANMSAIANYTVLAVYGYGLSAVASAGFGYLTTVGVESLHAGEIVTTHTSITYDKRNAEFDFVCRTIIKRGNYLVSDYTCIESFPEGSDVYAGWWNDFKSIISRGNMY